MYLVLILVIIIADFDEFLFGNFDSNFDKLVYQLRSDKSNIYITNTHSLEEVPETKLINLPEKFYGDILLNTTLLSDSIIFHFKSGKDLGLQMED